MHTEIFKFLIRLTLLFAFVTTANAEILTVTSRDDSGSGTLREAIANASSGDTIRFESNLEGATINLAQPLAPTTGLTIDAGDLPNGISLDPTGSNRAFEFTTNHSITLRNLEITRASLSDLSGAIWQSAGTVSIENCSFDNNTTTFSAGAGSIYIEAGTMTISDSRFLNGNSRFDAGTIRNDATLNLTNCDFTKNEAHQKGGAISNRGQLTATGCTFYRNFASDGDLADGGAIYNHSGATASLTGCSFTENISRSEGGAIYNLGTLIIEHSTFSGNDAPDSTLGRGGALYNTGGSVDIVASSFTKNSARNRGGAICNVSSGAVLTVESSTFSENASGTSSGGAIYTLQTATLTNSTLHSNTADSEGGAIYSVAPSSLLTVRNCTITANVSNRGSGIATDSSISPCTLQNSIVAQNTLHAGGANDIHGSLTSNGHNLVSNWSNASGLINGADRQIANPQLAPLADYGGSTLTRPPLRSSPVLNAGAAIAGLPTTDQRGLPRTVGTSIDIGAVESQPITYTVTNTDDIGPGSLRDGLAYLPDGSTITFDPSLDGATISVGNQKTYPIRSDVTIDASSLPDRITISGNDTDQVFDISANHTVEMHNLVIAEGRATGSRGGGIEVDNSQLTLIDCWIKNCTAGEGAGISAHRDATLVMQNCTVSSNTATSRGGGIHLTHENTSAILENCTIANNTAAIEGGGIYANEGTITLNHVTIYANRHTDNTSDHRGSGIATERDTQLTITNSIIAFNGTSANWSDIDAHPDTTITPLGNNIVGDNLGVESVFPADGILVGGDTFPVVNPRLDSLTDHGGPTPTRPPVPGSPALDAATSTLLADQRGVRRPADNTADIGAVESLPDTVVVDTLEDQSDTPTPGGTSLREAIDFAVRSMTIKFHSSLAGQTIILNGSELDAQRQDLTIDASDLPGGITISGDANQNGEHDAADSRVMRTRGSDTTLNNLTITGGYAADSDGGGIWNQNRLVANGCRFIGNHARRGGAIESGGLLELNDCTIANNEATQEGGGLHGRGEITLNACTLSANRSDRGGGLYVDGSTARLANTTMTRNTSSSDGAGCFFSTNNLVFLSHCTITNNTSATNGGGVSLEDGRPFQFQRPITLENSIVAGNRAPNAADIFRRSGSIIPSGSNLIGDNDSVEGFFRTGPLVGTSEEPLLSQLAPLGLYGGPTETMPPLPGSPAIDATTSDLKEDTRLDQRGVPRPDDDTADLGAVESLAFDPVIDNLSDSGAVPVSGDVTLRKAIEFALPGATITFAPDLVTAPVASPPEILVSEKRIAIDGSNIPAGLALSGGGTHRIFRVTKNSSLTLENITLQDGRAPDDPAAEGGGAVVVTSGSSLTLTNCTAQNNSSPNVGGAISNIQGSVTTTGSTFSNNHAHGQGGGGAIHSDSGSLNITLSTFDQNSASTSHGGALTSIGDQAEVQTSTFSANAADGNGGAIYADGFVTPDPADRPLFSLSANAMIGNTAASAGGAMFAASHLFGNLNNTTFSENQATDGGALSTAGDLDLTNTTIVGNTASNRGGGFDQTAGSLTLTNNIVAQNTATTGPDAAIDPAALTNASNNLVGDNTSVTSDLPDTDPLIGNSTAPLDPQLTALGDFGGPTQTMVPLAASLAIDGGTTSDLAGDSDQRGFARTIDSNGADGTQIDIGAVETSNPILVTTATDDLDAADAKTSFREAITSAQTPGQRIVFDPTVFDGEPGDTITLDPFHGQIAITGQSLFIDASNIVSQDGTPVGVTLSGDADKDGTPIGNVRVLTIDQNSFLAMRSMTITGGYASGFTFPANAGGAILNRGALELAGVTLTRNTATDEGGAIYNDGGQVAIAASSITHNTAGDNGGAISNANSGAVSLDRSTVAYNRASDWAGAIFNNNGSHLTATNTTIANNSSGEAGGAILNNGSHASLELTHATIAYNTTDLFGGAICNSGSLTLHNTIVAKNTAFFGPDIDGSVTGVLGNNLVSDDSGFTTPSDIPSGDPMLSALGDFGGPTQTIALRFRSPAIDAAAEGTSSTTDQRGMPRVMNGTADLGAYETGSANLPDYDTWATGEIPAQQNRSFSADADGDGSPNGNEFALGTGGGTPDPDAAGNPASTLPTSGEIQITFGVNPNATSSLAWVIYRSFDLVTYEEIYRFANGIETTAPGITTDHSTPNQISIQDFNPSAPNAFYQFTAEPLIP